MGNLSEIKKYLILSYLNIVNLIWLVSYNSYNDITSQCLPRRECSYINPCLIALKQGIKCVGGTYGNWIGFTVRDANLRISCSRIFNTRQ